MVYSIHGMDGFLLSLSELFLAQPSLCLKFGLFCFKFGLFSVFIESTDLVAGGGSSCRCDPLQNTQWGVTVGTRMLQPREEPAQPQGALTLP